ncbi:MAG: polysaccharide deacetylase family protein [Bacteroidales bacterium]|nr:polysaccharide deacetylase family protein [Bacteroidales bacterium]
MRLFNCLLTVLVILTTVSCTGRRTNNSSQNGEESKIIALSFDDGPNTSTTPKVLDVLEENGIKASFFVIGQNINEESSKMMLRAHSMGCDIENHTFTHTALNTMTKDQMLDEIAKTSAIVKSYVGEAPSFYRPPYISTSDEMFQTIQMPAICGQGCDDWVAEVSAEERARRVIESAQDGQIVLLHDFEGNDNTVEALKTIIPELKKQGFTFVTVPEIFAKRGVSPQSGKMYTHVND